MSASGEPGHDAVVALGERSEDPLDHGVVDERPGGVVDDHDERVVRNLLERGADGFGPRCAARDDRGDLRGDELLGEHDRGLLPVGGNGNDDGVDPGAAVEPLEALGQQHPTAERHEGLRPVGAESLT